MNKNIFYGVITFFIFAIDRASKMLALLYCLDSECIITPFLSFEVLFNRGVAFGLFNSTQQGAIIGVIAIQLLFLAILIKQAYNYYKRNISIIGYLLVLTGTLCNMVDRFLYRGVIDFIDLHYGDFSWPLFNIADVAIVFGVLIILIYREEYDDSF